MIRMGRALGLRVVGEGIEEDLQATRLRELGCDAGQGYLLGRPISREGVLVALSREADGTSGANHLAVATGAGDRTVGEPLIGAQVTERRNDTARLDHELEEVAFDRLVGPPAVLHDPLVTQGDDPAPPSRDIDGMRDAGGGADYPRGVWGSEVS
jgi:hypothetical protein